MAVSDIFRGTGVAMITPFNKDGEINFKALEEHADRLIHQGIAYLVVLGTTAETPTLSGKEKAEVVRCVMDSCGSRVPVMVGVGGNDTRAVTEGLKNPMLKGVKGVLSVAPYYNKPSQEGMYQHFAAIATVSELPVLLYNVPGRTSSNLAADTCLRLAHDFQDKFLGIKEASGDFAQLMDILKDRPRGFLVLSGDDAITLPMIAAGGDGVISVIGNAYPAFMSTLVAAALDGSYEKSRELHYSLFPMMKAIFKEGNPAGVKASMEIQGWIENAVRLPLIPVTKRLYEEIALLHKELMKL